LGTELVICGELGGGAMLGAARNGVHVVKKGMNALLAEEGKACGDCIFVALWFRWLGVVEE
jgi:hypothetical protein